MDTTGRSQAYAVLPVPDPGRLAARRGSFKEAESKPEIDFLQGQLCDKEIPCPSYMLSKKGHPKYTCTYRETAFGPLSYRGRQWVGSIVQTGSNNEEATQGQVKEKTLVLSPPHLSVLMCKKDQKEEEDNDEDPQG